MTKTEKLQGAWEVLGCNSLIEEMLIEAEATHDKINSAINRLSKQGEEHILDLKRSRLSSIVQQMALIGATAEDLVDFLANNKPKKQKKAFMHVATIDGVEVFMGKPIPDVMKNRGWNRISKIDDEFLTEEYRNTK